MLRAILVQCLAASVALAASDASVFVLRRDGGSFRVERLRLAEGDSVTLVPGEDGFVDIILPPSVGGSGSIVQHDPAGSTTLHNSRDGLKVETVTRGQRFAHPAMSQEDLAGVDIRLSVRSGDGSAASVIIHGYQTAEIDAVGPVMDIFAGKVPLGDNDCSIFTSTYEPRPTDPTLAGSAPLEFDGKHHYARGGVVGGPDGRFVIDMGAAVTVLTRAALPEDCEITPQERVQFSGGRREVLPGALSGATGETTPLGACTVGALRIGDLEFTDADAVVIESFDGPDGGPVLGVIGMNLLGRAVSMRVEYPHGGRAAELRLGPGSDGPDGGQIEIPISMVSGIPFCRARVGGRDLCLAIDTGARATILTPDSAAALGLALGEPSDSVRGLSDDQVSLRGILIPRLELAGAELQDLQVHAGPLPVLQRFDAAQPVGLLGNDVLQQFRAVELDLGHGVLRLIR